MHQCSCSFGFPQPELAMVGSWDADCHKDVWWARGRVEAGEALLRSCRMRLGPYNSQERQEVFNPSHAVKCICASSWDNDWVNTDGYRRWVGWRLQFLLNMSPHSENDYWLYMLIMTECRAPRPRKLVSLPSLASVHRDCGRRRSDGGGTMEARK